jgi:pimeloyl-ACP methyl ester carboxylesterase
VSDTARAPKPPVIMVHGAFCGGWAFEAFRAPFEAAGHAVLTPDLTGRGANSRGGASMADFAAGIAELVRRQEQPPVLIGHSLGGLVAQMAAAKAPVRGLILLAPSAPWGVAGGSIEEAVSAVSLYALGPFWMQAVSPDYAIARTYSLDKLDRAARKAVFARMAPESGRALWETLNWWLDPLMTTMVSAGRIKAPVLGVAGGRDLVHPPATVLRTVERLGGELKVFDTMSHWLVSEPGWKQVAEACLTWIARQDAVSAA